MRRRHRLRCQVGTGKANVSESLTTCRDDNQRDIETGVQVVPGMSLAGAR